MSEAAPVVEPEPTLTDTEKAYTSKLMANAEKYLHDTLRDPANRMSVNDQIAFVRGYRTGVVTMMTAVLALAREGEISQ